MGHFDESELDDIKPGPIAWVASHPVAANLLMVILLLGGFLLLLGSKQEVFPEFTLDLATVSMAYPGASPEEVEQGILLSIEDAVKDIEGIGEITSNASESVGTVIIEIDDEDQALRIVQDIKTAVDQITTFPVDAENLTVSLLQNQEQVMELVLHGSVSERVLRDTAEVVRSKLEQSDGISLVELSNVRNYEIHIEVPQDTLRRYNLSIPDIATIISRTSLELGGGALKTSAGEILVRMTERRDYAPDFSTIPIIKNGNGSTVYLGDIATIKDTFADQNLYTTFNDKPAIQMQISSTAKQTPITISTATRTVVDELNKTLPGDLEITITDDRSIIFEQRAELLIKNGVFGLVLVVLFLAIFLDIRLAFWVSLGIPISYMGAFLLFPAADYFSINMVSMFAFIIALGIVVDDAIVVGENIYHKREQGMKPLAASVAGAREMAIPVTVSVLTNIIAFMPMFFMPGFMGKIFSIIPLIVIATFTISLVESLFILPAHLVFKQSKEIKNGFFAAIVRWQKKFNRGFDYFIVNIYLPILKKSVYLRYISLSLFLFVLIAMGSYVISGRLGIQMFPKVESDFSYSKAVLKVGAPESVVKKVEQHIVETAQNIIAENGGDQLSLGVYSQVNENEITIRTFLTDPSIRTLSTKDFTALWRKKTGIMPGLDSLTFLSDFGGPGSGAALTVELSHEDTHVLDEAAMDLAKALDDFPNTQDINDGTAQGKRQFDFTVSDLGYTLGLTPVDVGRQVRSGYYGSEALKQQRGRNEVRVLVMLPKAERESLYHFTNLMIKTPNNAYVMLKDVVDSTEGRAFTTIKRRNSQRVITVESDVSPQSEANLIIGSLKADVLPDLVKRYPGLSYSFEGQQADMRESLQSLFVGMIGILFVMYAILAVLFSSYSQPLMIMIAIPFSIVGAIIGHFIMGYPMSIVSMFGIIALAGVVINDSLILIDLANKKRKEDDIDSFQAVVIAARQRFRPIILTTMTTFVGLAPMMFESSLQARFLVPMAISLGFGIVFSTFLTLVLIPSLYMINEDLKRVIGTAKRTIFPPAEEPAAL
tara:strand:+ start:1900 stop:5055 length:3156 start_codon:yes stop_codon:yes gene_type:complete